MSVAVSQLSVSVRARARAARRSIVVVDRPPCVGKQSDWLRGGERWRHHSDASTSALMGGRSNRSDAEQMAH